MAEGSPETLNDTEKPRVDRKGFGPPDAAQEPEEDRSAETRVPAGAPVAYVLIFSIIVLIAVIVFVLI